VFKLSTEKFAIGVTLLLMVVGFFWLGGNSRKTQEEVDAICAKIGLIAKGAMEMRQFGLTLQENLKIQSEYTTAEGTSELAIQLFTVLTIAAYDTQVSSVKRLQKKQVISFNNEYYSDCLKGNEKNLIPTEIYERIIGADWSYYKVSTLKL